ncbi:MAG TPA: hypothetical protein VGU61_12265 [Noviherbaspirillum sp.]|jgi:hypothetical protein|uniref:hypothetical protein n=1 Tax=Noviherbaspirillum sp. TaxID=1926288 RepID=UPI002DDD9FCD|nr:hypothetical protein [Noviherbaspirillum sp.]HEV2611034.1 hypothetical protein [Noviherbaspirillum sp.]
MSIKEGIALMLLVIAFGTAPLSYFIGWPWGWLALGAAFLGVAFIIAEHRPRSRSRTGSAPDVTDC